MTDMYILVRISYCRTSWPSVTTAVTGQCCTTATLNGWAEVEQKAFQKKSKLYNSCLSNVSVTLSCSCSMGTWIRTHRWWVSSMVLWWLGTSVSCLRAGTAACVWELRSWPASCPVSIRKKTSSEQHQPLVLLFFRRKSYINGHNPI